jgi:hypothetical protein
MFLIRLVLFPFRLLFGTARLSAKTGYRTGRMLGYRRMAVFGVGVAVGLALAPMTGAEMRRKISGALGQQAPGTPIEEPLARTGAAAY